MCHQRYRVHLRQALFVLWGLGLGAVAAAQADFSFLPLGPTDTVNFTQSSAPSPTQCDWDFGDPVNNPPVQDMTCGAQAATYQSVGIYTVKLTVHPSLSSLTKDVGVLAAGIQPLPMPAFTPSDLFPLPNQVVSFTDGTTPASSVGHWIWDFGDGTTSYIRNPSHSWPTVGDKVVTLTVENNTTGHPSDASTTRTIHVSLPVTNTPTLTPTVSPTLTLTASPSPTITVTPTVTPSLPPGTTVTATPTPTVTSTPTITGTAIPGTTLTPTITETGTPSGPTATRTRTPIRTRTPTITPNVDQTLAGYLGVVGSTEGAFGSFFKTAVQLTNTSSSAISGLFRFFPQGTGGPTDLAWSLPPHGTLSYDDLVAAMGKAGLGSMNISAADGDAAPLVLTRIYNDGGAQGTSGFTEPFLPPSAIPDSGGGYLVGPADTARYRYNIGVRTLDSPVALTATVRDAGGTVVRVVHKNYGQINYFVQVPSTEFFEGFPLPDNASIQITFQGGGLIIYGATVDNITNDPSAQFMSYGSTSAAQKAGSPSRRSRSPLLLAVLVAILGLGFGGVIARR